MSESRDISIEARAEVLQLAGQIVCADVRKNQLPVSELPAMIKSVHGTLGDLKGERLSDIVTTREPRVALNKSVTPDYIICLEDGKELKMLKRYLRTRYGLSPEEYRARWNLPKNYPMVAPNYSVKRSKIARKIRLGHMRAASRSRE